MKFSKLTSACLALFIIGVLIVANLMLDLTSDNSAHNTNTSNIIVKQSQESIREHNTAEKTTVDVNTTASNEAFVDDVKIRPTRSISSGDNSVKVRTADNSASDNLLLGKSLQELNAFHEKQMQEIEQTALNPSSEIQLPPSDDLLPNMTLQELDEFQEQQEEEILSRFRDSDLVVLPASNDEFLQLSWMDLELMHQEQEKSIASEDDFVQLPSVLGENEIPATTVEELNRTHADQEFDAQLKEYDDIEPIKLPPSSDGPYSISNWELIEFHNEQYQQIRQKVTNW
jgi:hypothetical protein